MTRSEESLILRQIISFEVGTLFYGTLARCDSDSNIIGLAIHMNP